MAVRAPIEAVDWFDVTIQDHDCPARSEIPDPTHAVLAGTGQQGSVRIEADGVDSTRMALPGEEFRRLLDIPGVSTCVL